MGEYASVLSLAKMKGARPVTTVALRSFLNMYPYMSVNLYEHQLSPECRSSFHIVNPGKPWKEAHVLESDYIYLDKWPFFPDWFHVVAEQLKREEFVCSRELTNHVDTYLKQITDKVSAAAQSSPVRRPPPIFIGIHARRTDYAKFMSKLYHAKLSGGTFFFRAAELIRDLISVKHPELDMSQQHLAFVVASDDVDWCRQNLAALPSQLMGGNLTSTTTTTATATSSVHFSEDHYRHLKIRKQRVYFDMAVLSNCNHSIFDYGTFGFWAAYLADGITVMADVGRRFREQERIRGANLTDWHLMKYDLEDSAPGYGHDPHSYHNKMHHK